MKFNDMQVYTTCPSFLTKHISKQSHFTISRTITKYCGTLFENMITTLPV